MKLRQLPLWQAISDRHRRQAGAGGRDGSSHPAAAKATPKIATVQRTNGFSW